MRTILLIPMLVLAACGSPAAEGSARSSPTPSPDRDEPVSSDPGVPGRNGSGPGYEIVEPRPGMHDVRARPFERVKPSEDGRRLTVIFWSGIEPCNVLDRVEVEETAGSVTITLYEGSAPAARNTACIEIAVKKAVEVELDEPLGGRKVVDGAA
jgi:hypothetical protein